MLLAECTSMHDPASGVVKGFDQFEQLATLLIIRRNKRRDTEGYWNHLSTGFRVIEFKPTPVVETKLSGEQTIHQTYHVAVAGYPDAAEADMYA